MKELLEHIKDLTLSDANNSKKFAATIEQLYFLYIRPWYKVLSSSEPVKIASDLVRLETTLGQRRSIQKLRLKSAFMKENSLLLQLRSSPKLEQYMIDQIYDLVIEPNRFYIPAAMTAEIINKENAKDRWRWLMTVVLSLLAGILAIISKQLGDLL